MHFYTLLGNVICFYSVFQYKYLILKSSFYIVKILGASGINALSRIIGFIVIAIGVEFIISAVVSVFNIA